MSHQDHRAVNPSPFTRRTPTMANTSRTQPFQQGDYLTDRRRPNRDTYGIPVARQVAMPRSTSFPSGHAASAFAFATGVGYAMPAHGLPLHAAAAVVAYSRVHTGVHYPADVVVGSVTGAALGQVAVALRRRSPLRRGRAR